MNFVRVKRELTDSDTWDYDRWQDRRQVLYKMWENDKQEEVLKQIIHDLLLHAHESIEQ